MSAEDDPQPRRLGMYPWKDAWVPNFDRAPKKTGREPFDGIDVPQARNAQQRILGEDFQ